MDSNELKLKLILEGLVFFQTNRNCRKKLDLFVGKFDKKLYEVHVITSKWKYMFKNWSDCTAHASRRSLINLFDIFFIFIFSLVASVKQIHRNYLILITSKAIWKLLIQSLWWANFKISTHSFEINAKSNFSERTAYILQILITRVNMKVLFYQNCLT